MFVTIRPEVIRTDKIMNESEAEHEMGICTPHLLQADGKVMCM